MTDLRADVRAAAVAAYAAGICVLPAAADGSKRPGVASWRGYQEQRPDDATMHALFPAEGGPQGIGFVCGAVSGGLELFEFDSTEAEAEYRAVAAEAGMSDLIERLDAGYSERTPNGGLHWLYRAEGGARPNTKLAMQGGKVAIETRGEGGWVVVAPSGGPTHPTGNPYALIDGSAATIPTLTDAEREVLWGVARALGDGPGEPDPGTSAPAVQGFEPTGDRPGDAFNARAPWPEILEPHGWRRLFTRGTEAYWNRPGAKDKRGIDATTGARGHDYLYVFSTSAAPFETDRGYDKLGAYALLNYGGDVRAAVREVMRDPRYGDDYDGGGLVAPPKAPEPPQGGEYAPPDGSTSDDADPVPPPRIEAYSGPVEISPAEGFDHAFPPEHFVTRWIKFGLALTDAAAEYHEAAALVALAAVTPGIRARLSFWPRGLSTNLYVMLLGQSSTSRKSTAMAFGEEAIRDVWHRIILPDRMSPEAWIEQMAMRSEGASVWVHDEIGKSLAEWAGKGKPQNQSMVSNLLSAYDGKPIKYARHSKRVKGGDTVEDTDVIEKSHLSILGATTPSIYSAYGIADMAEDGLLPRFAIVMPRTRPPRRRLGYVQERDESERTALVAYLSGLQRWTDGHETAVNIDPEALVVLDAYMETIERRAGDYPILARLGAMAIKVAMLSAVGYEIPRGESLAVTAADAEAAIRVCTRWAAGAVEFSDELTGGAHTPAEQRVARVVGMLREAAGSLPRSTVMKRLHLTARECDELQDTLIGRGVIVVESGERAAGARGPAPVNWRIWA